MKKKLSSISLLALLMPAIMLFTAQCRFEPSQPQSEGDIARSAVSIGSALRERNFSDERILLVMSNEFSLRTSSRSSLVTSLDFSDLGIGIERVELLNPIASERVRVQREAARTGVFTEELQHLSQRNTLVDEGTFRKVLSLTLEERGHDRVIAAIEQIRRSGRADILSVSPDHAATLDRNRDMPNNRNFDGTWGINAINLPEAWNIAADSQYRPYPRQHFRKIEGLGNVVVNPKLETGLLVLFFFRYPYSKGYQFNPPPYPGDCPESTWTKPLFDYNSNWNLI